MVISSSSNGGIEIIYHKIYGFISSYTGIMLFYMLEGKIIMLSMPGTLRGMNLGIMQLLVKKIPMVE